MKRNVKSWIIRNNYQGITWLCGQELDKQGKIEFLEAKLLSNYIYVTGPLPHDFTHGTLSSFVHFSVMGYPKG